MKNFKISMTEQVVRAFDLPQFFKATDSSYYKIIDNKNYLQVNYYGQDPFNFGLYLYPKIQMHSTDILSFVGIKDIQEITEEEFQNKFIEATEFLTQQVGL